MKIKELKYLLHQKLYDCKANEVSEIKQELMEYIGCKLDRLNSYMYIKKNSNKQIPLNIAIKIAEFFKIPVVELVNNENNTVPQK